MMMEQSTHIARNSSPQDTNTIWFGFYFKITGSSSSNVTFAQVMSNGTFAQISAQVQNSTGNVRVLAVADVGRVLASASATDISDGDWHFVEIYTLNHNTAGEIIVRIDEVEVINVTDVDTRSTPNDSQIDDIRLYGHGTSNRRFYDHFYTNDSEFQGPPVSAPAPDPATATATATAATAAITLSFPNSITVNRKTINASASFIGRTNKLTITSPNSSAKTQWRFNGKEYTITSTAKGTNSESVIYGTLSTIEFWLPPNTNFTVQYREQVRGVYGGWSATHSFTSRGTLNSYERGKLLNSRTITR